MPRRIVAVVVVVVVVLTVLVVHLRHDEGGNSRRCRCWRPVASFRASSLVFFFFFFFSLPSRVRVSHEFVAVVGAIPARRGNPVLHPSRVIHPTVADERIVSSVRFESEIGARQRYTARRVHKPTTRGEGERDVTQDYPRSHVVRTPLIVHAIDTLLRFVLRFTYFRGFGDFVTQFFRFLWSRVVLEKRKDIGRLVLFKTKFVIESIYIYIKYFMS